MKKHYFIAIVPNEEEIIHLINTLKEQMADNYQAKHALKSPPHITLYKPFWWDQEHESEIILSLSKFAEGQDPGTITLKDFGCFKPRVIYIQVVENKWLHHLKTKLIAHLTDELALADTEFEKKGFHPHMTIAHRDLSPNMFKKAWEEFKEKPIEARFTCNNIKLLKHDGKKWQVFFSCPFSQ